MTTTEATTRAISLCHDRTVICVERYTSCKHPDARTESLDCSVSIHPAIIGTADCQQFKAPSFEQCLNYLTETIAAATAP